MATITRPDGAAAPDRTTHRGDRFVAGGLLLLAALFAAVQVLAGEVIPPLAAAGVVYAVLAAVLWRRAPRWLLVALVALVALHVVTSLPFLVAALAHPETPASFLPDAFILVGALTVVAGALARLRGVERRRSIVVPAVVGAAGLVLLSLVAAAGIESHEREAGDVAVPAVDTTFPARVEVPASGAALWVDNRDAFRHTLVVEGADVHVELPGLTATRVEVDLDPGVYHYFCDVPGHERMAGELVAR